MRKSIIAHEKVIKIKKNTLSAKKVGRNKIHFKIISPVMEIFKKTFVKIRLNLCSNVNVDIFSVPEIRKYFRVAHFHKLLTVCDLRLRKNVYRIKYFGIIVYVQRLTTSNSTLTILSTYFWNNQEEIHLKIVALISFELSNKFYGVNSVRQSDGTEILSGYYIWEISRH